MDVSKWWTFGKGNSRYTCGLFGVSIRWISNFVSTTFYSTLRLKTFFCSGCPISQLHVFGDDFSSGNWGFQSILHIPATNHIVSRVPAINSITPTIHSPIDRFFGFQTLPRRQQTHSLTNVSHLFVSFFGIYTGLMAIPWSLPWHTDIYIYLYIHITLYLISHQLQDTVHNI